MALTLNLTSAYLPNPICIGDVGSLSKLQFTGLLAEIKTTPEFKVKRNVKEYYMRQGVPLGNATTPVPGNRILLSRGSIISWYDIEFESTVSPTQLTYLLGLFNQDPGACIYSPDNGTTNYDCIFQADGLVMTNYPDNQRLFTKVHIKLHICGPSNSTILNNTLVT